MSTFLEIEAKSFIKEGEYLKLIKGSEDKCYKQINYYLDTKDFALHALELGLRVRELNGKYELTLKVKKGEGKLEINQTIEKDLFLYIKNRLSFPDGEVKNELLKQGIKVDELFIFVVLTTTRLDVKYKGALISIDKSEFNGITDYEVECESDSINKAKSLLIEYLNKNEVHCQENFTTKLKRAKDSL